LVELYPFQKEAVESLWSALCYKRSALCVMATGLGKTEVFIELVRRAGVKTVVLLNRDKLVEQTARRMGDVSVYSAGQGSKDASGQVVVASIQSFYRQITDARLIICDEAHNVGEGRYAQFLSAHPNAKIVGFTATPWRMGYPIYGEDQLFDMIDFHRGIPFGISRGYIVPPISKAPPVAFDTRGLAERLGDFERGALEKLVKNPEKVRAQVEDAMSRLTERKKIVWVCTSIAHAEMVRALIPEESSLVHSKVECTYPLECFEQGTIRHLVSVMKVTEGYDYRPIDAIVFMRPTKSPTLAVQVIGRALRTSPGKQNALILDYGEVIRNCGPIDQPNVREKGRRAKDREEIEKTIKVCPGCLSYLDLAVTVCPDCGHEFKIERDLKLSDEHEESILISEPETISISGVSFHKHQSKKGNLCIRVDYEYGIFNSISEWFSAHPYSWGKGQARLSQLTPWNFESWQEAYDAVDELVVDRLPVAITVRKKERFHVIEEIHWTERSSDRERDTDIPF
jgi:DNA repair protein RadD